MVDLDIDTGFPVFFGGFIYCRNLGPIIIVPTPDPDVQFPRSGPPESARFHLTALGLMILDDTFRVTFNTPTRAIP